MTISTPICGEYERVIARPKSTIVCWTERIALLLLGSYLCLHTLPRAWSSLNTDFPNYYLSARLAREHVDTARMYEWAWLQREKDHRGIDPRIIGLLPITPFSTLAVWPMAELPPLTAKRVWIAINLLLLVPVLGLLHSMTGMSWQRVALVLAASFPLHRNLLYGQFYVVLLLLIAGACWAYLCDRHRLAGALVALAVACKLFPAVFVVFFLRRRAWRALASAAVTGAACAGISIAVFGWNLHRVYLQQILPWVLRGEALPPYDTMSNSLSSVLHSLLLSEPQWNPHPWHDSPLWFALLFPALQIGLIAPAILLIRRDDTSRQRVLLEWSALLTASLAVSTIPASYNFVLLAFPVAVLAQVLLDRGRLAGLAIVLIAYLGVGFPMPPPAHYVGPWILLYVPRLILTVALLMGIYVCLWSGREKERSFWRKSHLALAAALAGLVGFGFISTFHQQVAARSEYAYRVPQNLRDFIEAEPQSNAGALRYIRFSPTGYRLVTLGEEGDLSDTPSEDDLSFSAAGPIWDEKATDPESRIVALKKPATMAIAGARDPMSSTDGQTLAFIRDVRGSGQLMMLRTDQTDSQNVTVLTPASLNVYEGSFLSPQTYAFSAVENGSPPAIYLTDATHWNTRLDAGESRYPALSSDQRWLVYSRLERGSWNLWLRDEFSGAVRRIADVPCNQIEPSWLDDSKTVLYTTDCGRSLWFTAIARRRIVP
ncbi:MAG TPA: glycosyltransferase 87 family protein [Terracidiphilus sp.]|nr:glycosyltransferase 87 family protein [Terracidiphilus sp.]